MLSAYKAYHSSSPMAFAYKYTISVSTLPVADLEGVLWNPSFEGLPLKLLYYAHYTHLGAMLHSSSNTRVSAQ